MNYHGFDTNSDLSNSSKSSPAARWPAFFFWTKKRALHWRARWIKGQQEPFLFWENPRENPRNYPPVSNMNMACWKIDHLCDFPIETSIDMGCPIDMFDYRRVNKMDDCGWPPGGPSFRKPHHLQLIHYFPTESSLKLKQSRSNFHHCSIFLKVMM